MQRTVVKPVNFWVFFYKLIVPTSKMNLSGLFSIRAETVRESDLLVLLYSVNLAQKWSHVAQSLMVSIEAVCM